MIDALDLQHVERIADVLRRTLFAGMRDRMQAELAAAREHASELLRRVAALARVESDANELAAIRHRFFQRRERLFLAEMAQEAHDQRAADAELALRANAGSREAADHRLEAHAARGMGLRIEEQFGVDDVVGGCAREIRHCHVLEILCLNQHARAGVVDVEEALQVGERIGGAQRSHARVRERDAIALRQREDQLGLERAFDVDV